METRNLLIIRDADGELIAAQIEEPSGGEMQAHLTPAEPQHTLDRVADVPAEICETADPAEFHRLLSQHVNSPTAKITRTNAVELQAPYLRALTDRGEATQ